MCCHQLIGRWKQVNGAVGERGKLTDDNLDVIAGKREILSGKIQERHGIGYERAKKEFKDREASLK
jgi:uncharacterized protein YjbJ (UPF0337 family)